MSDTWAYLIAAIVLPIVGTKLGIAILDYLDRRRTRHHR